MLGVALPGASKVDEKWMAGSEPTILWATWIRGRRMGRAKRRTAAMRTEMETVNLGG